MTVDFETLGEKDAGAARHSHVARSRFDAAGTCRNSRSACDLARTHSLMDLAEFREYCLTKPVPTEETPFGPDVLVFKVGGKMFALAALDEVPPT